MDCRTCQPTLLDLAHGELAPELAATVREHVRGCASCGAALANLESGLALSSDMTWLEPPRALRVNAMALAERHLQERAKESAQARASARPRASFVQAVLDFIGRMAAGPQVAMATIMMLIVAVGLWSLPELQRLPPGQGVTVVNPTPEGEAAPSGGLAPAEPLDLAVDARSRRIRSREELAAASNAYKAGEAAVEPATEEEQVAVAMAEEPLPPPEKDLLGDDPLGRMNNVEDVIAPSVAERSARSAGTSAGDGAGLDAKKVTLRAAAERKSASKGKGEASPFPDSELQQFAQAEAAPAAPTPASAPAKPASRADLDDSLRSGGGVREERDQASASTASTLTRARQTRSAEGCAAALSLYEQAVKDPATQGVALVELATCLIDLGRVTAARTTLERAQKFPQVASRARDLLAGLDAKSAPVQAAPPAAAPAEAP